jgi:hypothetical protein
MVQQEQQACVLQEDIEQFLAEIFTLRSLAKEAGVAYPLLEELEVFQHEVEHLDASAWERKEVRFLKRNDLVRLCMMVLRAYLKLLMRGKGAAICCLASLLIAYELLHKAARE